MKNYKYSLDKSSKKYRCPACEHKTFVPYLDNDTGEWLSEEVGICDRINNCAYHYPPRDYFKDNRTESAISKPRIKTVKVEDQASIDIPPASYLPERKLQYTMRYSDRSNFVKYLQTLYSEQITACLIQRFHLGSLLNHPGATVFWQQDVSGHLRTGKIMQYDPKTGSRMKGYKRSITDWMHNIVMAEEAVSKKYIPHQFIKDRTAKLQQLVKAKKITNYKNEQCLFGEHQLITDSDNKTVAVVESEKTAILMSVLMPKYLWMACGSASNLKSSMFEAVRNRPVILYPDLGCYRLWMKKMIKMQKEGFHMSISGLLEKHATAKDRAEGLDLADFFIRRDPAWGWALAEAGYPLFWDHKVPQNDSGLLTEEQQDNYRHKISALIVNH